MITLNIFYRGRRKLIQATTLIFQLVLLIVAVLLMPIPISVPVEHACAAAVVRALHRVLLRSDLNALS